MNAGPDFICIGMPKTGTGWLYDQLDSHPDFWMPPVKELLYLQHEQGKIPLSGSRGGLHIRRLIEPAARPRRRDMVAGRIPRERDRDLAFLEAARASNGKPRNIDGYVSLFSSKGARLSGDVSPMYCELDPEIVRQVADRLPAAKLVLLVRDPVARAWSRISMTNRGGRLDLTMLDDPGRFAEYLRTHKQLAGKSHPTRIVEHWSRHAPAMDLRAFLFDGIAKQPDQTRREIFSFLGADPDRAGELAADYNRKSKVAKLELGEPARTVLVEYFADELKACAEMFGGYARDWPRNYGL